MARSREPNGVEPPFSEEDIQRRQFGPRGVPGAPDPAKMTPQREKKTSRPHRLGTARGASKSKTPAHKCLDRRAPCSVVPNAVHPSSGNDPPFALLAGGQ